MPTTTFIPVLIAGAGPVGLTLAADLAWRGVACLVVDPQVEVHPYPRAISIGVRSMEHFRRLGLADLVIDAGVPRSRALDVVYTTRMLDRELFRFRFPSIEELFNERAAYAPALPEVEASPYFKTWTAQSPLERKLRARLQADPKVELRFGWRLEGFEERGDGVEATIADASGATERVACRWLVGCDGASSTVRTELGLRLEGRGTLGRARGVYFRAPALDEQLGARPGVMYWTLAPGASGVLYTIDGQGTWVFNRYFAPGEEQAGEEPAQMLERAIGRRLQIEILSMLDWLPRQLVAPSYGTKRVFLAGDACHLFVPTGGFGMNTGIGDAVDLAWKIAAMEEGWGGARLMASYDAERRPVGTFNTLEAADNYARSGEIFEVPAMIEEDGAAGDAARAAVAGKLPPKLKHFAPIGVHLGYRYEGSPLIAPDGTPAPRFDPVTYAPSARPGSRAPHAWLPREGRGGATSTLDLFGRSFVLLRFEGTARATRGLEAAARDAGVPLEVVPLRDRSIASLYGARLVLVRPDGHVAWRGETLPGDPGTLVDTVRGA